MKQYYKVTFEYSDGIYCTNLAHAETIEDVEREYSCYSWNSIKPAQPWDVDEARVKGMPIVEVEPAQQPQEAPQDAPSAQSEERTTPTGEASMKPTATPEAAANLGDMLKELVNDACLVECWPGWCTSYQDPARSLTAVKKAIMGLIYDINDTPDAEEAI